MISEPTHPLTRRSLRTPRAAALAGIVFSLLLGTSVVLIQLSIPDVPPYEAGWLSEQAGRVSLAVTLVPFAGLAFLWFMGVIRNQIGEYEDRFFSTVFFGSGLLFLGGLFVWMTVIAAVLASFAAAPDTWPYSDAYIFGRAMIKVMGGVVTLRMAGAFMFSSGTIWSRTEVMPRWLVWLTFLMAVVLLLGGPSLRLLRLGFPIWVLVVSLFLLRVKDQSVDNEDSDNDDR
jgi:hypothetical protein